jgi:hypothetical protein
MIIATGYRVISAAHFNNEHTVVPEKDTSAIIGPVAVLVRKY